MEAEQNKLNEELFNAIDSRNYEKVKECIKRGSDVNCYDCVGATPLLAELWFKDANVATLKALIDASADVNAPWKKNHSAHDTPLHVACHSLYDSAIIQLLVNAGADVNKQNKHDETPLTLALLSHKSQYFTQDNYTEERRTIVHCLLQAGADTKSVFKNIDKGYKTGDHSYYDLVKQAFTRDIIIFKRRQSSTCFYIAHALVGSPETIDIQNPQEKIPALPSIAYFPKDIQLLILESLGFKFLPKEVQAAITQELPWHIQPTSSKKRIARRTY